MNVKEMIDKIHMAKTFEEHSVAINRAREHLGFTPVVFDSKDEEYFKIGLQIKNKLKMSTELLKSIGLL